MQMSLQGPVGSERMTPLMLGARFRLRRCCADWKGSPGLLRQKDGEREKRKDPSGISEPGSSGRGDTFDVQNERAT